VLGGLFEECRRSTINQVWQVHSGLGLLATSECYLRDVREWSAVDAMVSAFRHMEKAPNHHAEACWVAASGKAELYVRDRLGATLASRHPKLTVAREWNKHDLAVLDANLHPLTIVEGKHLYDFDLLVPNLRARYKRAIKKDCDKLKGRKLDQPLISLLMTSLRGSVPSDLARVVKYAPGSNRKFKEFGRDVMPMAVKEARVLLGEIGSVVHEQELAVGHCFGIDVHLWVWLAEPGKPRRGSGRKRR